MLRARRAKPISADASCDSVATDELVVGISRRAKSLGTRHGMEPMVISDALGAIEAYERQPGAVDP